MRTKTARRATQLENVAFSVADMDEARWLPETLDRLAKVIEPVYAFLLFDRHSGAGRFLTSAPCFL